MEGTIFLCDQGGDITNLSSCIFTSTAPFLPKTKDLFAELRSTMANNGEGTPLLSGGEGGSSYYFLNNTEAHQSGTTPSVRDTDGGAVTEVIPEGSRPDEFAPRPVGVKVRTVPCRAVPCRIWRGLAQNYQFAFVTISLLSAMSFFGSVRNRKASRNPFLVSLVSRCVYLIRPSSALMRCGCQNQP